MRLIKETSRDTLIIVAVQILKCRNGRLFFCFPFEIHFFFTCVATPYRMIDGETRIGIFATRDIKKGEYLTYDYQYGHTQFILTSSQKNKFVFSS